MSLQTMQSEYVQRFLLVSLLFFRPFRESCIAIPIVKAGLMPAAESLREVMQSTLLRRTTLTYIAYLFPRPSFMERLFNFNFWAKAEIPKIPDVEDAIFTFGKENVLQFIITVLHFDCNLNEVRTR